MTNKMPVIAVPTKEISKIVQEKLFDLGYEWKSKGKEYRDLPISWYDKRTYIDIDKEDKTFGYSCRGYYLEDYKNDYYEITMYDLYQLPSVEFDSVKLFNEKGELVVELSRQSLENLKKLV